MQRKTTQRNAIEQVFFDEDRPLGIDEILRRGRILARTLNRATVYRNLKLLTDKGWLKQINHPVTGTLFERTGKGHHHHFHCHDCNRVFELPGCSLNQQAAAPEGFVVEDHEIFLFGICPSCAAGPE
jgi:Fur family transcriptional regulator, ferric uptake regulator